MLSSLPILFTVMLYRSVLCDIEYSNCCTFDDVQKSTCLEESVCFDKLNCLSDDSIKNSNPNVENIKKLVDDDSTLKVHKCKDEYFCIYCNSDDVYFDTIRFRVKEDNYRIYTEFPDGLKFTLRFSFIKRFCSKLINAEINQIVDQFNYEIPESERQNNPSVIKTSTCMVKTVTPISISGVYAKCMSGGLWQLTEMPASSL